VSHHCDETGCIAVNHLSSALHHIDNLARQRCLGVLLVTFNDIILMERPCSHATASSEAVALQTSCRKVQTIRLDSCAAARVFSQAGMVAQVLCGPSDNYKFAYGQSRSGLIDSYLLFQSSLNSVDTTLWLVAFVGRRERMGFLLSAFQRESPPSMMGDRFSLGRGPRST